VAVLIAVVIAAALVVAWLLGYVSWMVALVPIGIVFAVMLGYWRRTRGPGPGPR
jgi:hypothetical protein